MSTWSLIYSFNTLVQFTIVVFFFSNIMKPKYLYWSSYVVAYIVVMTQNIVTYMLTGSADSSIGVVLKNIILFLVLVFMFEGKFWHKVLLYVIMYALTTMTAVSIPFCEFVFSRDWNGILKKDVYAGVMMIQQDVYFLIILLAIVIWRRQKFINRDTLVTVLVLFLFPIFHIVYTTEMFRTYKLGFSISLLQNVAQFILLIIFMMQYENSIKIYDYYKIKNEYEKQERDIKATYDYYVMANQKYDEISEIRHDMKNMLISADMMLKNGNSKDASDIIDEIGRKISGIKAVRYCDNEMLNTILTVMINKPENKSIDFNIVLKDCDDIKMDTYDLCSLFSNLTDNACEAARQCEETHRFVKISSAKRNDFFIIKIQNSYNPEKSDPSGFKTTKTSKGHGYGTKIVSNIQKKYDIDVTYDNDTANNVFEIAMIRHL